MTMTRKFINLTLWFLCMAVLGFCVSVLSGCGGGDAAMPFGDSPHDSTTQPVTCEPTGCAK